MCEEDLHARPLPSPRPRPKATQARLGDHLPHRRCGVSGLSRDAGNRKRWRGGVVDCDFTTCSAPRRSSRTMRDASACLRPFARPARKRVIDGHLRRRQSGADMGHSGGLASSSCLSSQQGRSKSSLRLAREWRMRVESVMLLCGCARGVSRPGRREFTLGNKAAECSPATMGDAGTAEPVRIGNRGSDEQDPEQPSVVEERKKRDGRVGQRKQWRRSEWRTRGCSETR
ncbi:hypothetical protein C8F01DRAFT_1173604 [Mycena amicta]|nr:hypothetical protein C8F01DRAFT_1173183 [Mycena amicta]KAJ7051926.1 hypothetical protein C8F01DRAFT_1173604 [Mycena amicta]